MTTRCPRCWNPHPDTESCPPLATVQLYRTEPPIYFGAADRLRYGPTSEQMESLRISFRDDLRTVPGAPDGFRLTVENVLTEAFQAGIKEGRKETLPLVRAVLDWRNARALYRHYLVLRPRASEAELNRAKNDMDEALDNLAVLYSPEGE